MLLCTRKLLAFIFGKVDTLYSLYLHTKFFRGKTITLYPRCKRCGLPFRFFPSHEMWVYSEKERICYPRGGILCEPCHYECSKQERETYWSEFKDCCDWDQIKNAIKRDW